MVESSNTNTATLERTPAALRIARLLQEKIERQEFRPGEWLPTERELAREFSADRSTIRAAITILAEMHLVARESGRRPRVLSESPTTHAATATSRVTTTQDSGTRYSSGGPLVGLKTIAAVIPHPPNYPASALIQRGILRALRREDAPHRLIVFDNQGETWEQSIALERQALEALEQDGVAGGILWHMGGEYTLPLIQRLVQSGVPLVLLDRRPTDMISDFVGVDNRTAANEAVAYLIQLGHRRIAHLTSTNRILTIQEREAGYLDALRSAGIEPSTELIYRIDDHDDLYPDVGPAVTHFLALKEPPTALFAMKDLLAHAVLGELKKRGIRVPEEMSVIGFDDDDRHALQTPILTTVQQPFENMGLRAAELLLRRLMSPEASRLPAQHLLLPTPLVVRSTCSAIPAPPSNRRYAPASGVHPP